MTKPNKAKEEIWANEARESIEELSRKVHEYMTNKNKAEELREIGGKLHKLLNNTLHRKLTLSEYLGVIENISTLKEQTLSEYKKNLLGKIEEEIEFFKTDEGKALFSRTYIAGAVTALQDIALLLNEKEG